jgi:hypothetical protein
MAQQQWEGATMPQTFEIAEHYSGRSAGVVPVNFSLDREAAELLRRVAPGMKTKGRFISRLIFEYAARQEERERLRDQLTEVLKTPVFEGAPHA